MGLFPVSLPGKAIGCDDLFQKKRHGNKKGRRKTYPGMFREEAGEESFIGRPNLVLKMPLPCGSGSYLTGRGLP
jgi:hypothetical protein